MDERTYQNQINAADDDSACEECGEPLPVDDESDFVFDGFCSEKCQRNFLENDYNNPNGSWFSEEISQ